jgi:hypothetical protein
MDSNSIAILDFFQTESNVRLFKKQFLEKLIDSSASDADCCENEQVVPLQMIDMEMLEERKLCIPFDKWRTFQSSSFPVVQNVFWHICSSTDIALHELREGINEVNTNMHKQGNKLQCFIDHSTEKGRCLFYLYFLTGGELTFINATVLVLNDNFNSFEFDFNGNCLNK